MDQDRELRTLVVEESPGVGKTLLTELAIAGYHPIARTVASLDDVEAALDERWDVVLCSIDGANVGAVVEALQRRGLDVPVIAFSARADERDGCAALSAGARDFVLTRAPWRLPNAVAREVTAQAARHELRKHARLRVFERVARGVAHDVNNLLTVMNGFLEIAKATLRASRSFEIEETLSLLERAGRLCTQLLRYDQPPRGKRETIDVNATIEAMRPMLSALGRSDVLVDIRLRDDLAGVETEIAQLEQVVVNLVVNARDAMPEGGTLTIETDEIELDELEASSCRPPLARGRYVVLRVRDTGIGMDEDTRERIFEPYFTTKQDGNGIGLATVHEVVARLEGGMRVTSRQGKGTMFEIVIPRSDRKRRRSDVRRKAARGHGELVLLVDDDELFRRAMRRNIEAAGYQVAEAERAREALEICAKRDVAVVVTDLAMPGMSGEDLVEHLVDQYKSIGVVVVSGFPEPLDLPEGVMYLDKPTSQAHLLPVLHDLIEGRRARDTPRESATH